MILKLDSLPLCPLRKISASSAVIIIRTTENAEIFRRGRRDRQLGNLRFNIIEIFSICFFQMI